MTTEWKDRLYWHEMADRTHVARCIFYSHILIHPYSRHPELKEKIHKIAELLGDLYQSVGRVEFKEMGE